MEDEEPTEGVSKDPRERARHAWDDWTDEDIAREFAPWTDAPSAGSADPGAP